MDNHKMGQFFKSALSRGAASVGLALALRWFAITIRVLNKALNRRCFVVKVGA